MSLGSADGRWMDGLSAEDYPARCTVQGSELVVSAPDGSQIFARWPVRDVRVDAMHEGGVVNLEWSGAPNGLVTIDDALFVKTLRASGSKIRGLPVGRRGLAVGLVCGVAVAALMAGFYAAAPWVSANVAARVPVAVERKMAAGMEPFLLKKACSTPTSADAVKRIMKRLDPEGRQHVEIRVVNMEMPNAFALPGSVVLLTRGLLEGADSSDEIAGVLAHELGHVSHRHPLSHMIRSALLAGAWAVTLGDYSGLMIVDPKTAYETATLKYSREAEAEADETGLGMLSAAHVSAQGLMDFFERNSKGESPSAAWLSSHPASKNRIALFAHQALREKGPPVLDGETFYRLRTACEGVRKVNSVRDLFF